jgi:hypothetical protein
MSAATEWPNVTALIESKLTMPVLDNRAPPYPAEWLRERAEQYAADPEMVRLLGLLADYPALNKKLNRQSATVRNQNISLHYQIACALERFEHVAEEYRTLRAQVMAVQRVLDPDIYGNHGAKSADGARFVRASLGRATIRSWDQERDAADAHDFVEGERGRDAALFEGLTASHRARAAQLRNDPDA